VAEASGPRPEALEELVAAVLASPKYRQLAPDLVRRVGARELAKRRTRREALDATRRKLHQVGSAYLAARMPYGRWLEELRAARDTGDPDALRRACAAVMAHHASTRERLPLLDRFYRETLLEIAPIHSVLDVACGLHPLAIPWMPLAPGAVYHAWEIYADLVAFLNHAFPLLEVEGRAELRDALSAAPAPPAELALLLKSLPCLEQLDPDAAHRLLDVLPAPHLLVSFPSRTLGGRRKGMAATYDAHFAALAAGRPWRVRRFDFPGEQVFRVTTLEAADGQRKDSGPPPPVPDGDSA
jgi:16S rRNA (guanine(1405)-N(7))-methyltransferase